MPGFVPGVASAPFLHDAHLSPAGVAGTSPALTAGA